MPLNAGQLPKCAANEKQHYSGVPGLRRRNTRTQTSCNLDRILQARVFARLLHAFFERSGFTAQIGENFSSEMQ